MDDIEWEEVDLTTQGNICATKNDKIALIDADTIIVGTCSTCSYSEELLDRDSYPSEEWESIISEPGYDPVLNCIDGIDLDSAYTHAMDRINQILQETGCTDFELHFTGGRQSFRYIKVSDTYKANRVDTGMKAIYGIWMLKQVFLKSHPDKVFLNEEYEADDIVVSLKRDNPDKYIMCAVDKDVLYSIPGRHFNYYSSVKYSIHMKFVEVDEITAKKHHYHQTLTGDKGDNIIGLNGIGPKKANDILEGLTEHEELWNAVVKAYDIAGRNELDALTNMRLVSMHQLKLINGKYEVVLWRPM